jgi:hypothetical protein
LFFLSIKNIVGIDFIPPKLFATSNPSSEVTTS